MTNASDAERELGPWLRRLKWALSAIPADDRNDIVAETRAHLAERVAEGQAPKQALEQFGEPEEYARLFLDARELSGAAASQAPLSLLKAVSTRAHRSIVAAAAFLLVLAIGAAALAVAITAINKVFDPAHSGLWAGGNAFFVGVIDRPQSAHELLGGWIYPLAVLWIALCWIVARLVLVWAVRRLARAR
jgi:uncharacterized membrane protein